MFVRDRFGNLVFIPRNACFVEAEGAAEGAGGAAGDGAAAGAAAAGAGEGKGAEGAGEGGGKEGAAAAAEGAGNGKEGQQAAAEWRAPLPDDLKKHAERFNSPEDLVKSHMDLRQKLSKAIVPPGKDAQPEEVEAYRKLIGVPAAPDGYKFQMPEGAEPTDNDKAFHGKMAEAFHALNITKEQAKGLNAVWNDVSAAIQEAQVTEDKQYAAESEAALKRAWGKDYDANVAYANRAAAQMFGDDLDEVRAIETKDGRFVMDNPAMLKALAMMGREMAEGGLVPPMSADQAEQAEDQLRDLRKKQEEAKTAGDHKRANKLYQDEMALIGKMKGSRPIVGSAGRAA